MARPSTHPIHPRELVLTALKKSKRPLSAYDLLEKLAPHGIKGPPVVYRALEALAEQGLVHKIHATGGYVACNCGPGHDHAISVLTICGGCKDVRELHDHDVIHHLEKLYKHGVRLRDHAVVELPVMCEKCSTIPAKAGNL